MTLMRGASTFRNAVGDFLAADVPPLLVVARQEWGLEDWQLPDPVTYNSYDPLTISAYPAIGSIVRRTAGWTRKDISETAEQQYNAIYSVLIFIWCITPTADNGQLEMPVYDTALRCRDDEIAVVRSSLLRTPSMNSGGAIRLQENTLQEDYLDAIKMGDQNPRWTAGATITADVLVDESAYLTQIAEADTIITEVQIGVPDV